MSRVNRGIARSILLGPIVVAALAWQASTLIARAESPPEPPGSVPSEGDQPLQSDVTIATTSDPAGAVPNGASITYRLTVANEGAVSATAVSVSDRLGEGTTFASATAGCSETSGLVACALGDIGAGMSLEVGITVTVDDNFCGAIVNAADVSASNEGSDRIGNNAANEVTNTVDCEQATPPDLRVSKSSDAEGILHKGDSFRYTITVTNVGGEDAIGVGLMDRLPRGALNVAVPPFPTFAGRSCTVTSSAPPGEAPRAEIGCGPVSLAPGDSAAVTVKVIVSGSVCGSITNVVDVEGANEPAGRVGPDNHAEASDQVACSPRVRLRQGGPSFAHVGDTITYAFSARNNGDVDLSNIRLSDPSCDGSIRLVDDGNGDDVLAIGESWHYRCDRTIRIGDGDPVHSEATLTGVHRADRVSDSDTHDVNVIHPGIDLVQSAWPTSGPAGTLVAYTYTVRNSGDTALFDVSIDDDTVGHVGEITTLAPGQTVQLTHAITLGPSPITSVSIAEGADLLGASVTDADEATVTTVARRSGGSPFTGSGVGGLVGWVIVLSLLGVGALLLAQTAPSAIDAPKNLRDTT